MAGVREQLREKDRQHDVARGLGVTAGGGAQREGEERVEAGRAERRGSGQRGAAPGSVSSGPRGAQHGAFADAVQARGAQPSVAPRR